MTLTFKSLAKNGKYAYYRGAAQILRLPIGVFANKTAPPTIPIADGLLAGPKDPKAPRAKLTAEERKAKRAAKPALTLAEKIARREAALAKLKAQAQGQAPEEAATF